MLEVGAQRDGRALPQVEVDADEGGVVPGRAAHAVVLADEHGGDAAVELDPGQLGVMLEGGGAGARRLGLGDPQLDALERAAVVAGGLLRVRDRVARRS